jgi:hypothetical protein
LGRLLRLFRTSYIFEPPQHFRRGAIHMLEHLFSHKRRCLLSGANKATSTTQDANRRVNGKVCHAEANVRLVGQFRVGGAWEGRSSVRFLIALLDLMFSGHQQSEDFEVSGRLRPAHLRNGLFPVLAEIA